jgi:hypothetical protein|mmetsp:Transcript_16399/g.29838  ORF Transcript_16399/g.29838 Transcript_16399/m.29838 type:complete len:308 (-) Transcript_16399:130-1053(-)|eukprot:CAMPEP_0198288442 /NCGR_PEP_ID=MMETSP1449-20131203/6918_1 /TAXON_ID=420275 /ORGANISM="Attheya septentrionalis, Strain CCMP2084" /LENGTH=307 /DNA_ID=CAMNT_0043986575 /DNA_START=156 /DNA_END=1079 /DNA_ORIENTATION=-
MAVPKKTSALTESNQDVSSLSRETVSRFSSKETFGPFSMNDTRLTIGEESNDSLQHDPQLNFQNFLGSPTDHGDVDHAIILGLNLWEIPQTQGHGFLESNDFSNSPQRIDALPLDAIQQPHVLTADEVASHDVSTRWHTESPKASKKNTTQNQPKRDHEQGTVEPTDKDVLCVRGGEGNNHPGNKTYLEFVEEKKYDYEEITKEIPHWKSKKTEISQQVVDHVHEYGGRFLGKANGVWIEVEDSVARKKSSQALREGQPKVVAQSGRKNKARRTRKSPQISPPSKRQKVSQTLPLDLKFDPNSVTEV